MNIRDLISHATQHLAQIDSAQLDAEVLLAHCLNKDRSYLYAWPEKDIETSIQERFLNFIEKRKSHYPIAYLIGEKEFWSFTLNVTEDTLIPRPETELLVETCLAKIKENNTKNILELATGTGAISLALASEDSTLEITATDFSSKALDVAKQNAEQYKLENIQFVLSNWFEFIDKKYDLIIANPPYVAERDQHLQEGDAQYEPISALASGKQGLDDIEIIISQAKNYLNQDGYLILEHGYDQADSIKVLFEQAKVTDIQCIKDYAGLDRVSLARWPLKEG